MTLGSPSRSLNRTVVALALTLVAVPTIGTAVFRWWTERATTIAQAQEAPAYTIFSTETSRSAAGDEQVLRKITLAQRADGARSEISIIRPDQPGEIVERTIVDPNGSRILAYDNVGMRTTLPMHELAAEHARHRGLERRSPASDCLNNYKGEIAATGTRIAETRVVDGLRAVRLVDDEHDLSAWHAPALGCEVVELSRGFSANGELTDWSERRMTSYQIGEPDPIYFDVTALEEVSPTTAKVAQYESIGAPTVVLDRIRTDLAALETKYMSARTP